MSLDQDAKACIAADVQSGFNRRVIYLDNILSAVRAEALRALVKHPPLHSPHEAMSVIREESDELWDHVKADTGKTPDACREAIQVAAMGARYVMDLIPIEVFEATTASERGRGTAT
jgi:hypothetical protein